MGAIAWITANWPETLQNLGIISGLFFSGRAALIDSRYRRLQTHASLAKTHRDIWSLLYSSPDLARVLDPSADIVVAPPTQFEEQFIKSLIFHLAVSHGASVNGFFAAPEALEKDVKLFFELPIPREVWIKLMPYQEPTFVAFVERARRR